MTSRARFLAAAGLVFTLALLVRGLYLEDGLAALYTSDQDGTRMARRYDDFALGILHGEGILFPRVWDPAKTGLAFRPPGYSMFLASVYALFGRSFPLVSAAQDVLASLAAVLVMAVGWRRFGPLAGVLGGLLVASSPHIAATSNLILADAIAPLPLLLAFTVGGGLLTASATSGSWKRAALAGLLIGAGVWIRPNVLLLGPFAAFFVWLLAGPSLRSARLGLVLAVTSLAVVAPITLRNWLVLGEFIPVSINGGITLWQGVADAGGREYGARVWDKQVIAEEAERYGRPDYLLWWAEPDGVARDRDRYRRAREVISARPFWYAKAMLRRMGEMLLFVDGPRPLREAGAEAVGEESPGERVPLPAVPALDRTLDESRLRAWAGTGGALRGPLRLLHALWSAVPLFVFAGIVVALKDPLWRTSAWWLVVPLYYLIFESPFLYEWRVAVPMQYFLLPFAGHALAWGASRLGRRQA